jgi:hypothetical protein
MELNDPITLWNELQFCEVGNRLALVFLDTSRDAVKQVYTESVTDAQAVSILHSLHCTGMLPTVPTAMRTKMSRSWLEMTDERKRGTVETYVEVYEPLKQLGVPASVWDEILEDVFHEPFGTLAPPFQELLFELEIGKADYPRRMESVIMTTCAAY